MNKSAQLYAVKSLMVSYMYSPMTEAELVDRLFMIFEDDPSFPGKPLPTIDPSLLPKEN